MIFFTLILCAYLMGSIPFGLILVWIVKGVDIRQHGSGNLGATNVFRVIGKPWGIIVLLLDALKGWAAVTLCQFWPGTSFPEFFPLVLGSMAILGHAFPIWLAFKGGKGVATSLGVFLAIAYKPMLITVSVWILVFWVNRIISLASLTAAFLFPLIILLTCRHYPYFGALLGVSLFLALFIFYTHRQNILRLCRGEEKRLI